MLKMIINCQNVTTSKYSLTTWHESCQSKIAFSVDQLMYILRSSSYACHNWANFPQVSHNFFRVVYQK